MKKQGNYQDNDNSIIVNSANSEWLKEKIQQASKYYMKKNKILYEKLAKK